MLRDFLVIFGIACDERSAIEICRGVPSIWGLSVDLDLGEPMPPSGREVAAEGRRKEHA